MSDRRAAAPRRTSLTQTAVTVAAAALICAALVWSALFYSATRGHASAVAARPAPIVHAAPAASARRPASTTVAPVTTRTS